MPRRIVKREGNISNEKRTPDREPEPPLGLRHAVLYARVSSKEQEREGFSIPAQQALLHKYAHDNGISIQKEFIDVETAKQAGRTHFTEMVSYLKKHKGCRIVLVEKTDRLYRNVKDWILLEQKGLEIHFVKDSAVLSEESHSTEKFMHGIRVLMAKHYIDNLSEEITKGMKQKAVEGHWPSSAPLGYMNRREGGKSYIVPNPDTAPLVRNLFEYYATGNYSLLDLAAYAKKAGLKGKRGSALNASTVHHVLQNPIYVGEFLWDGVRYRGKDPTLVTRDLWENVQEKLAGPTYARDPDLEFAFIGMVTCGHCGYGLTAELKKKQYIYYRCTKRCTTEKYVREEQLVTLFGQELKKLSLPPHLSEALVSNLRESRHDIKADIEARYQSARQRYERLGKRIDAAYEDKLDGNIDDALFQRKRAEWEKERSAAFEEMERLRRADAANLDLGIKILEFAKACYSAYLVRNKQERRDLLNSLISNSVFADGVLTVKWRSPFDLIAKIGELEQNEKPPTASAEGGHPIWWRRGESNP